jgi:RNA polymerase sigma-70 factor (ECF subfamily)
MDRETEFRNLFADHYMPVVGTVFMIVQDRARAEEITQDAFMQLLRHWNRVSRYEQPEAWIRRVAIRLAVRSVQREQRLRVAMARMVPQRVELPDAAVSAEVLAAVRELSPKQRAVVVLFYFEDRPVAEIAQILDCSESAAAMRLQRAREHLAVALAEEVDSHVG